MPGDSFLSRLFGQGVSFHVGQRTEIKDAEQLGPVGSVREAQQYFPFQIKQPAGWGEPSMIAATPVGKVRPDHASIAMTYQSPYGQLTLLEQGGDVVSIRGGIQATVESTPSGSMLRWVENGVSFTLVSPKATTEQLRELAERI